MLNGYHNLKVWNKAYKLTLKIYRLTKTYPKEETYGLSSQMRRASTSIIANIAEGYGNKSLAEYIRFVNIALGSCNELSVYILLSNDLNYLDDNDFKSIQTNQEEITKMLLGLRKALKKKKSEEKPKWNQYVP